jgi:hypothetical protein
MRSGATVISSATRRSSLKPIQRAVVRKQNHQAPLSDSCCKKAVRKRGPAPYARIVGRPLRMAEKEAKTGLRLVASQRFTSRLVAR